MDLHKELCYFERTVTCMAVLMFGKGDKCWNDPWQCSLKRFKTTRRLLLDVNRLGISEENGIYQERIIILSCIYFTSIVLEIEVFTIDITHQHIKPLDWQLPILLQE